MLQPTRFFRAALGVAAVLVLARTTGFAAATFTQDLSPSQVAVGYASTITLTVRDESAGSQVRLPTVDVSLPLVDGLLTSLAGTSISVGNGVATTTLKYTILPSRPGIYTIPAFDVRTRAGDVLHVKAMILQVAEARNSQPGNPVVPPGIAASSTPAPDAAPPVNPRGPVVMPPANPAPAAPSASAVPAPAPDANAADSSSPDIKAPRDPHGGPAKVFIIITPVTTNAYVGQAVPMEIDFYIRMDVNSDQNSLPTIKGSDFLMNNFTTRGRVTIGLLEQQQYLRETWITSISAPKAGDFPLSMQRDTYWVKSLAPPDNSIFGNFFNRRANLAHEMIGSNLLTMHIQPLPAEGRPDHFTGAIGQFKVTGESEPGSVAVGEPVHLRFTVSGEGNFDYVRSPALADDPAWKAYVPVSRTQYVDEPHVHALKAFDQSVIPQKGGVLPLPQASFSYFDPALKQYITVPITLPAIVVTGSAAPAVPVAEAGGDSVAESAIPPMVGMLPNRLEIGSTRMNLTPAFRRAWFWGVQAALVALPLIGAALVLLQARSRRGDEARASLASRARSLHQEQDAMREAVRSGDARAFFLAARHAIQLQLGAQWNVPPEALTFREIRARDPQLAAMLEPLFQQADEVIYSGHALPAIDLASWEQRVRTEILQPQPA